MVSTWRTNKNSINELIEEYKELKKAQEQGKLDSVSAQRLLQVQNELAKLMPTIVDHIDEQGNSHLKNIDAVEKELDM